ncbi:MAG: glycosyltransferase [Caulobacteraceae bacterium]|nr:glycosyltransferase [Caulobacteraceae bacterium]
MGNGNSQRQTSGNARSVGGAISPSGRSALLGNIRQTNPDRLRVVWYSNAPWAATGYGQQTAQVIQRLAKEDHQIAVHAMYGLAGSVSTWNGFKMYPQGLATYSDDVVVAHTMEWASQDLSTPTLLMTLFDVWVLKSDSLKELKNIASWVPIDHQPAPPEVLEWCARENVKPIAMSKFGSRMLNIAGIDHLYVPHAIEPVFKPTETVALADGGKMTGRKFMGWEEDKFVISMVATNKGSQPARKAWAENLLAYSIFAKDHPDAVLYLYTEPMGAMSGINLIQLLDACGVSSDKYKIVDQYAYRHGMPQNLMAAMYTASDVLLACSMGEGFGIPVIEAQACGCRVIVSNFTAQPELVGDGWTVEGQPWWDAAQKSWFFTPSVPDIVNALKSAYNAPRGRSEQAISHAQGYGADTVFEQHWKPTMKELSAWCRS